MSCHKRQCVYKYVMMTILIVGGESLDRHSVCLQYACIVDRRIYRIIERVKAFVEK